MRHNVPFADMASETMKAPGLSIERTRGFEWQEEPKKQFYDSKPITGKIGHMQATTHLGATIVKGGATIIGGI